MMSPSVLLGSHPTGSWPQHGALNVLHLFEANGFPSDQLAATSYADTQPKLPNRSATGEALAENQAKNRRVLVYIKPRT